MEKRFNIKQGKHFFKGLKFQELLYPLGMVFLTVGIFLNSNIENIYGWASIVMTALVWVFFYFKMKDLNIKVKFDKECLYTLPDQYDQINKLFGFSFGHHHKNSARFGWRAVGQKIEIHTYCYVNGERKYEKLIDCLPEEWVELDLDAFKTYYEFKAKNIDGERALKRVDKNPTGLLQWFTYKLFPYFGGKYPAPHSMGITIIETEK